MMSMHQGRLVQIATNLIPQPFPLKCLSLTLKSQDEKSVKILILFKGYCRNLQTDDLWLKNIRPLNIHENMILWNYRQKF